MSSIFKYSSWFQQRRQMFPVMPWVVLFIYILLFTFHGLVLYSTPPEKVFLFSTTFAVHRVRKHANSWLREQMGKPSEACPTSLKVNRQETRDEWISVYPVPQIFNEWKMFFWILFRSDVANYRYLYLTESSLLSVSPCQWVRVSESPSVSSCQCHKWTRPSETD